MNNKTKTIVGTGILTAVVVVLQLLGSFIKFGTFSVSLVLIPIIVGAALYGIGSGVWLGAAFGVTVLLSGDAAPFLAVNPYGTVLTVILKGALAGLVAGAVYKLLEKKSVFGATLCAGITAPVVNTGVFLIGCLLFFMPTVSEWAAAAGIESAGKFMIVGLVGLNFVFELAINLVLSSVIVKLIQLGKRNRQ